MLQIFRKESSEKVGIGPTAWNTAGRSNKIRINDFTLRFGEMDGNINITWNEQGENKDRKTK